MTEEIKPCPFCGESRVIVHASEYSSRWVFIECASCGAQCGEVRRDIITPSTEAEDRAIAVAAWNTRKMIES